MKNNTIYCCSMMQNAFDDQRVCIGYSPKVREYYINLRNEPGIIYLMSYCPWCGKKLPKHLRHEWFDTLEAEYNITDPWHDDEKRIPEEFNSDEWWKKRDL